MKHTPGPWSAEWDDSGQWYVNIGGLSVTGNALRGDSGECVESARAHLIAAAPDLLAACRDIVLQLGIVYASNPEAYAEMLNECADTEAFAKAVNDCRTAVAKAEGRA